MLNHAIWWSGILLETLLLVRGFRGRLLGRYPVFYTYIAFVWSQSLLRISVYHLSPQLYRPVYLVTDYLGVLIGCGVVFEIYRVGLADYPGTARMARNLLGLVFLLTFTKVLVETWNDPHWWSMATNRELEGVLRTVQAVGLGALVLLFFSYSIPFGRNLRGVLLGYGLFIGESVIWLTFASSGGNRFLDIWFYLHPGFYFVVLGVWATHLWSYAPNPEPKRAVRLEEQYQRIAATTSRRLREGRGYLAKVVGS
jgi:hypothetical protein